jgi:uncharacterized membrane protein
MSENLTRNAAKSQTRERVVCLVAFALFLACSLAASAETIRGVVRNGTTNKPSAGDEVVLKRIAAGMEDVARTTTNSKGEFTFNAPSGQQAFLIWVKHQEVTYTKVAMPGNSGPVAVQVFDASSAVKEISLSEHILVLQTSPAGDNLKADEISTLTNQSSPPRTKNGQHTLDFYLPENAKVEEATAQTQGNMALKTSVVPDKSENNRFFFGYPLRPGQTQFRLSFSVPYTGKLALAPRMAVPAQNMMVVVPNSIKFAPQDGSVYSPQHQPQFPNVTMYVAKDIKPDAKLGFELQGTGELPREEASSGGGGGRGGQSEDSRPGGGLGVPNERPDPLHNGQWLFLGVLAVFLTAGAVYVYTAKPAEAPAKRKSPKAGKDKSSLLLEAMKEEVFQLESDRLQGKITQQEYETAKTALDKTLQRAVKRQAGTK